MPGKRITIKVTKTVEHKDGSPRWLPGTQIHTTREELKARGVPEGSYTVMNAPGGEQSSTPTAQTNRNPKA